MKKRCQNDAKIPPKLVQNRPQIDAKIDSKIDAKFEVQKSLENRSLERSGADFLPRGLQGGPGAVATRGFVAPVLPRHGELSARIDKSIKKQKWGSVKVNQKKYENHDE